MPPNTGRWGRITAVTRLTTGLILFFFVLTHNLNNALGLISLSAMEAGRFFFVSFWRPIEIRDTVNTSSRLETATKEENCQLLISETMAHAAELPADIGRRREISLRGRERTLVVIAIDNAALMPVSA